MQVYFSISGFGYYSNDSGFSDMTLLCRYTLDCSNMSEALTDVTIVVSLYRAPLDAGYQQMVRSLIDRGILDRGFLVCLHSLCQGKVLSSTHSTPLRLLSFTVLRYP